MISLDNDEVNCKSVKCGDISCSKNYQMFFNCLICTERYENPLFFSEHIQKNHNIDAFKENTNASSNIEYDSDIDDDNHHKIFIENLNTKLGEVLLLENNILQFNCDVCDERFTDFQHFSQHNRCTDFSSVTKDDSDNVKDNSFNGTIVKSNDSDESCTFHDVLEAVRRFLSISFDQAIDNKIDEPLKNNKFLGNETLNLKCKHCSKIFSSCTIFNQHNRIHRGDRISLCEHCNHGFLRPAYLQNHKADFHGTNSQHDLQESNLKNIGGDKNLECQICKRVLARPVILREHLKLHFGVIPYKCQFCDFKFLSKRVLSMHEKEIHEMQLLKCLSCNECFQNDELLKNHRLEKHMENHEKKFSTNKKLANHQPSNEVGKIFQCEVCPKQHNSLHKLLLHETTHKLENKYECSKCPKKFPTLTTKRLHESFHLEVENDKNNKYKYECSKCPKKFPTLTSKRLHESFHLEIKDDEDNKYRCEYCPLKFENHNEFLEHNNAHVIKSETEKIENNLDGHVTNGNIESSNPSISLTKNSVENVLAVKSEIKVDRVRRITKNTTDFICKVCNKPQSSARNLLIHERLHSSSIECKMCNKFFLHPYSLKRHMACHNVTGTTTITNVEIKPDISEEMKEKCDDLENMLNIHIVQKPEKNLNSSIEMVNRSTAPTNCNFEILESALQILPNITEMSIAETPSVNLGTLDKIDDSKTKNYSCYYCRKQFRTMDLLNSHTLIHQRKLKTNNLDNIFPFECSICLRRFKSEIQLSRHNSTHFKFSCKLCTKILDSKAALDQHCKTYHKTGKIFKCSYCPSTFSIQLTKRLHERIKHQMKRGNNKLMQKPLDCKSKRKPNDEFPPRVELQQPKELLKCHKCSKEFSTIVLKNSHSCSTENSSQRQFIIKCTQCTMEFTSKECYLQHQKTHIFSVDKKFKCSICFEDFDDITAVEQHLNLHDNKWFSCSRCREIFHNRLLLIEHKQKSHSYDEKPEKPLKCELCGIGYVSKACLKRHIQIKHSNGNISQDNLTANENQRFQCTLCLKYFNTIFRLRQHHKIHEKNPFKCNKCVVHFRTEERLIEHEKLHEQEKDGSIQKCAVCQRVFKTKYLLSLHKMIHTDERPISCSLCSQTFKTRPHARYHMKNTHLNQAKR